MQFKRIGRAWGFKVIVYALILPAASLLVAGLLSSSLVLGVDESRLTPLAGCVLPLAVFFGVLGLVGVLSVRDFRWRFPDHLALEGDRCEWGRRGRRHAAALDEIQGLRLTPPECGLRTVDGRGFSLRSEEWPVSEIRTALLERMVPGMVDRALKRMAAGETVRYGTPRRVAVLALFSAVIVGLTGLFWARGAFGGSEIQPRLAMFAFMTLSFAAGLFRSFIRVAGHEARLNADGLVLPGLFRTARVGWKDVERFEEDAEGVRIHRASGGSVRVERVLTNYPIILALIRASLGK
jgi:hypothetical protein